MNNVNKIEIRTFVTSLLEKYRDNLPMLDAINQWAMNPTPKSAGYGIEENYPYILSNLEKRYPHINCEDVVQKLKKEMDSPVVSREDIYQIRREIVERVKELYTKKFQEQIVQNLTSATLKQKKLIYTIAKVQETFGSFNPDHLDAFYNVIFGEKAPSLEELIGVGIVNKLLWIKSRREKKDSYEVPPYVKEVLRDVDKFLKIERPSPDVAKHIKKLFEEKDTLSLIQLEEILNSKEGFRYESSFHLKPVEGFIGKCRDYYVISPLVIDDARKVLKEEKEKRLKRFAHLLREFISQIRKEYGAKASAKFEYIDQCDCYRGEILLPQNGYGYEEVEIILSAWSSSKLLKSFFHYRDYPDTGNKYLIGIFTFQALPEVIEFIFKKPITEIDLSRVPFNITLVCFLDGGEALQIFGKKPKILDSLLSVLREKDYDIIRKTSEFAVKQVKEKKEKSRTEKERKANKKVNRQKIHQNEKEEQRRKLVEERPLKKIEIKEQDFFFQDNTIDVFYSFLSEAKKTIRIVADTVTYEALSKILPDKTQNLSIKILARSLPNRSEIEKEIGKENVKRCRKLHAKFIIRDDKSLLLSSCNITLGALGDLKSRPGSIEATLVTDDPDVVNRAKTLFDVVWEEKEDVSALKSSSPFISSAFGLPNQIVELIRSAKENITIIVPPLGLKSSEEGKKSIPKFIREENPNVQIHIFMNHSVPKSSEGGIQEINNLENVSLTFVKELVHAKVYIADWKRAIISSANLNEESWVWNLETGIITDDPRHILKIKNTIERFTPVDAPTYKEGSDSSDSEPPTEAIDFHFDTEGKKFLYPILTSEGSISAGRHQSAERKKRVKKEKESKDTAGVIPCLLYTSPSPRDRG